MRILNFQICLETFFQELESKQPLLMVDYDGTLAPFHPDPYQAAPYPGVMNRLSKVLETSTRLIIISGREIKNLLPFITLKPVPELWGSHGAERLKTDGTYFREQINAIQTEGLLKSKAVCRQYLAMDRFELKAASVAINWRGEEEGLKKDLEKIIRVEWQEIAKTYFLEIHPFDGGVEIRVPGINKGEAVKKILNEYTVDGGFSIAYLGDDLTDEDAFAALENKGLKILVREQWRPTHADVQMIPPQEILDFFDEWVKRAKKHLF